MGNGTPIGRVRALGSAHSGSHHWLMQRLTAIGNLFGGLWLAFSLVTLPDYTFETVHTWAMHPLHLVLLALLAISAFWHARLGLQVLIEDYVHETANKTIALTALNLIAFAGMVAALALLARIEITGTAQAVGGQTIKAIQSMMGGR